MLLDNYQGRLLIAPPKLQSGFFEKGVVLMVKHSDKGAWGVLLNRPIASSKCDLADIFDHVGMDNSYGVNAPLYVGGPVSRSRVCIIHSNDWCSASTIEITPELSLTTDISVLSALASFAGPSKFKVYTGVSAWSAGQLEGEMLGEAPWTPVHSWLSCPASENIVLDMDGEDQWTYSLAAAVTQEVKELF